MFLGGRFLTGTCLLSYGLLESIEGANDPYLRYAGLGSACAGASAKSYLAEMAPAHHRGAYMGFLNSLYVLLDSYLFSTPVSQHPR